MRALPLVLFAGLALTGCARLGSLNPAGWFGGGTQTVAVPADRSQIRPLVQPGEIVVVQETRPLMARLEGGRLDRTASGAVLSATGLAPGPGRFNAELVRRGVEGGVLVYDFRAEAPPDAVPGGSAAQRRIAAAEALEAADLAGIRAIRIVTSANSAEVR